MNRDEFINKYWHYYLMLEEKFIKTLQYVDLNVNNYDTYSNEFAMLIQSTGSELDLVFKIYCGLDLNNQNININNYCSSLLSDYSSIINEEIKVLYTDIEIKPFENWNINSPKQSLFWWNNYIDIKHKRTSEFKKANLKTALTILSALYLLEMKKIKNIGAENDISDIPDKKSELFEIKNWKFKYLNMSDAIAIVDN